LVSVNVAARQVADPSLLNDVAVILDRTGLPADRLQLEITEGAIVGSAEAPTEVLQALADEGVRIVIDDFGTGYSNLSALRHLPVHELKLAGPFLHGLTTAPETNSTPSTEVQRRGGDGSDLAIVGALVQLAHTLGLNVTAEGVETAGQASRLRELGCDAGQGWHFARPMDPEAFVQSVLES
jgi:EAL domain-containing protein (putative c-di-GMP-specific phosphodiesterase class I)